MASQALVVTTNSNTPPSRGVFFCFRCLCLQLL
nr:MAG TPA: hypothetical protein [Caudoviricetes sp.]